MASSKHKARPVGKMGGKPKRANRSTRATAEQDNVIINRVAEVAEKRGVSMTEVSLAWLLTKVASPVVGATKKHHVDGAVAAVDLELTEEEITWLEELYVPHNLVGIMATNK